MIGLSLDSKGPLNILFIGAHCDDIEIGCGGTILTLGDGRRHIVKWVVLTSDHEREKEALNSANDFLKNVKEKSIIIKKFKDGFLPQQALEVKEYFNELRKGFEPDLIFTHYGKDQHQDHKLISTLTRQTYRNHLILEYEIPKYDGDIGNPDLYVPLNGDLADKKADLILKNFPSQNGKHWFDRELFLSLLRLRGMESPTDSRYSEAFYLKKGMLNI